MIIRGILDRSLSSQICIRGFAPIKELARISIADYSYQRNPIYAQQQEIATFLDNEEFLFFPEVILSLKLRKDLTSLKPKDSRLGAVAELELTSKFTSNIDRFSLKIKKQKYTSVNDVRNKDSLDLVELLLDDDYLADLIKKGKHPFHRIDGNHRLKAAEVATSGKVKEMICPFCIILNDVLIQEEFDQDGNSKKVENNSNQKFDKVVFHNINTKTIPLTSEENLKVIIDDEYNFQDQYLRDKFGWEYFATRKIYKDLPENIKDVYPNLGELFVKNPRTFTIGLVNLLLEKKEISKSEKSIKNLKESFSKINQIFGNDELLKNLDGFEITIACVYLQISRAANVKLFINWVKNNQIYNLKGINPKSLIDIYSNIAEAKKKEIFVSMAFSNETKSHYDAIKKATEEINNTYDLEIKLRELRIDKFEAGYSYDINDEILKKIEESGLLIVDISKHNGNVYHELGYMMGLNQAKGLNQENFIIIKSNDPKFKDDKVGFNLTSIKQLRFDDTLQLVDMLKESLKKYYNLI
ncbi:hypothetical protein [Chryseobacterium sp. JV274]|uniref:hypothetical protein n=1 Tax=Chryseobacterium sp. JV274 TaxID=1932669 RepID=UPI0015C288BE|nr:hypothetical protein [Chryseobacterium sp. JV274]CAD0218305.1 conserved protein of unknown function [Chryseobacterium sp. JV274]